MNLFSSTLMAGVFAVFGLSCAANATVTTMVTQSTSTPTDGLMSTQVGVTTLTFDSNDVGSQPAGFTPPTGTSPGGGVVGGGGNAGLYAAPNGDMSQFYAVALNPVSSPTVPSLDILSLGVTYNYFGFYWGSIDKYNTLQFYNGSTLVAGFTGADFPPADGNQISPSTNEYVDFFFSGNDTYNRVVFETTTLNFEFDNVAFGNVSVPEPSSLALFGTALAAMSLMRRRMFAA
jgi:hypothetical protein